jgi:hypothetical protein
MGSHSSATESVLSRAAAFPARALACQAHHQILELRVDAGSSHGPALFRTIELVSDEPRYQVNRVSEIQGKRSDDWRSCRKRENRRSSSALITEFTDSPAMPRLKVRSDEDSRPHHHFPH